MSSTVIFLSFLSRWTFLSVELSVNATVIFFDAYMDNIFSFQALSFAQRKKVGKVFIFSIAGQISRTA